MSAIEEAKAYGGSMSSDAVRLTLAPVKALDSGKIVSAEEAASLIRDGDTIATGAD
jgi:propionate CoA-transferase